MRARRATVSTSIRQTPLRHIGRRDLFHRENARGSGERGAADILRREHRTGTHWPGLCRETGRPVARRRVCLDDRLAGLVGSREKFQLSRGSRPSLPEGTLENLLTRKLELFAGLTADDRRLLDDTVKPTRTVAARTDIIREGHASRDVRLVLDGFACRYKLLKSGQTADRGLFDPGRLLRSARLHPEGHGPQHRNLVAVQAGRYPTASHPGVAGAAKHRSCDMVMRRWSMKPRCGNGCSTSGQRDAVPRIGHLLCELSARLRVVGLVTDNSYKLPLTQTDIGDTTGLSFVHVNRSLQELRDRGLIDYRSRNIVIRNPAGLIDLAGFNPNYLHLQNDISTGPWRSVGVTDHG